MCNHYKCLSQLFPIYLNTYVRVYGQYKYFTSLGVGIVYIRQNLAFTDVIKTVLAAESRLFVTENG